MTGVSSAPSGRFPRAAACLLLAVLAAGCATTTPPQDQAPPSADAQAPAVPPLLGLEDCQVLQFTVAVPTSAVQQRLPRNFTPTQRDGLTMVATRMLACQRGSLEDRTLAAPSLLLSVVDVEPPGGPDDAQHRFALDLAADPPALAGWFAARGIQARPGSVSAMPGPPVRFAHVSDGADYGASMGPGTASGADPNRWVLHLPSPAGPVAMDLSMADDGQVGAAVVTVARGPLADLGALPLSPAPATLADTRESWTPM